MSANLLQRLETARRQRFVGRTAECELLQEALTAAELPFALLFIFGPGGVGKTSLLRQFAYIGKEASARVVQLDGRTLEPAPEFFLDALRRASGAPPDADLFAELVSANDRVLLCLDTYELVTPLDGWLRETFLPQLPANVLVVIAGRHPPAPAWRSDPGWQAMMRVLPLRNLSQEESRDFLARRHIPAGAHNAVMAFTHGHPLALSLVADVYAQRPNAAFRPNEAPDVIKVLLDQLVQRLPSALHRQTLEACALVRLTTESLLAALLQQADVHELFEWLRGLSFIDAEKRGLYPHDLAREALAADLRWRNPDWYAELHARARGYYMAHVQHGSGQEQRQNLTDYIFLHRDNPMVKPYFEWQSSGQIFTDAFRPADEAAVLAMVAAHEGEAAAHLAAHWARRRPQRVFVFRAASGEAQGVLIMISLEATETAERTADPALQAAWHYLATRAPLRPGETATYFRFWLARETYQGVSPVQTRIFLNMVQHYLTTPALAFTFIPCSNPEFWAPAFTYANLQRLPQADFVLGGRRYGVYGHDWRAEPPLAWLEVMAQRELRTEIAPPPAPAEQIIVLSEADFATAVRDALHDFTDPVALTGNPLLRSRLLHTQVSFQAEPAEKTAALQTLLEETAAAFRQNPRQLKLYRALYHTYFRPAPTQETAAELLDLPFSTYRRHLRSGVEELTRRLWVQELGDLTS